MTAPYSGARLLAALAAAEAERDAAREERDGLRSEVAMLAVAGKKGTYCTAKIQVAHESFGCLRWENHHGYHEGYVGCSQCSECGGWEAHADGCGRIIGEELPDSDPDYDVRWNDGDDEPVFYDRSKFPPPRPASRSPRPPGEGESDG